MKKKFVQALVLLLCLPAPIWAQAEVPVALLSVKDGLYSVFVDKSEQRLFLYNGRTKVMDFECSTGSNSGDKQVRGDKKTPEGVYYSESEIDGSDLPAIYGWRAYVMDYPNPVDRTKGKNGSGIWIHGRNKPMAQTDTKGCVSLTNEDLRRLSPYLHPYWTPIVTLESVEYAEEELVDAQAQEYRKFIDGWLSAWENKDFDAFRRCYSEEFFDQHTRSNKAEYLANKEQILSRYNHINISSSDPQIVASSKYVTAFFLMDFAADSFNSTGVKYVYIDPAGPTILNERFLPLKDAAVWQPVAASMDEDRERRIKTFLDNWIESWEAKDIERMQSFYAESFPGLDGYFARKSKNLAAYTTVDVILDDIDIRRNGIYYDIRAKQRFSSDVYEDVGLKSIRLVDRGDGFYIVSERWDRLENES